MAEQLAVEVDVKNVTHTAAAAAAGQAHLFCLDDKNSLPTLNTFPLMTAAMEFPFYNN